MAHYKSSRIIPIILVVVVVIIAIVALISLARVVFFSGAQTNDTANLVDERRSSLVDTAANRSVSMTVRGPIVAEENFHSYRIAISPNSREIKTFTGYLGTVVEQNTLGNNVAAYDQFVHALDKANLIKGKQATEVDVRGICATGRVVEFRILKDDVTLDTLWTSSCKGSPGTLNASVEQLTQLFVTQIPNSQALITSVRL